jgi:3-hydroxyacyl-CoA dehydrogenase/enoyl-CoA hydratase/3-hydroxybutyryl-CoA epimerase
MTESAIRYDLSDGIVTLTIDDPTQNANTMNDLFLRSYADAVQQVADAVAGAAGAIKGVVVASGKKMFFAGADLKSFAEGIDAGTAFELVEGLKATMRRLETLGVPVVAAINGAALGGGFELALACHHRIAAEGGYEVGLPEVTLGLLPGGGGVTRTVRMFGIQDALMNVLLQGQRMKPAVAMERGLLDEVVPAEELLSAARSWIESVQGNPLAATQPWDREGYRIPGGAPSNPKLASILPSFPSTLVKQIKGAGYRAPRAIMSAAVEGAQVDFETASRIESRYFVSLVTGQQARNMTRAFFFDLQAINAGRSRPAAVEKKKFEKVAVIGAGMMGAGIAYVSAKAGLRVVLKDVSQDAADKGKSYSEKLLAKQIERGRTTPAQAEELLARIHATDDYDDLAGCDLVVEAVFENPELKHGVFAEVQPKVNPDALLASNTSTLPITGLAEGVSRPQDFIGIHFFSPVDKMMLVEIIAGEKTDDETIAHALDYVQQIKKIPIVVTDSRGFFTSRVIGQFINEGQRMLAEGVNPVTIERATVQAGFPTGVLQISDELNLKLMHKIALSFKDDLAARGIAWQDVPANLVVDTMLELGRPGKLEGKGFYDYDETGRRTQLWPGLGEVFALADEQIGIQDVKDRLIFSMSLDTVNCLAEGVLRTVPDANIGSIFGIGFPPMLGGAIQAINGWEGADGEIGPAAFVKRAEELAARYGERFNPPPLLMEKAKNGERFV